jgi:hypothetical protein
MLRTGSSPSVPNEPRRSISLLQALSVIVGKALDWSQWRNDKVGTKPKCYEGGNVLGATNQETVLPSGLKKSIPPSLVGKGMTCGKVTHLLPKKTYRMSLWEGTLGNEKRGWRVSCLVYSSHSQRGC